MARQIALLLRSTPWKLWTAKAIAGEIRVATSTVSKELHRMTSRRSEGETPVVRVDHGLYRAFRDERAVAEMERPEPRLHAIQLGLKLPQNRGFRPPASAPRAWGAIGSRPVWVQNEATGQWMRDELWDGRRLTVTVTPTTGAVQVALAASRSEENVAPEDFGRFLDWLNGVLHGWGVVWSESEVSLQNVELNLDYRTLGLGDVRKMRLKRFRNAWAQVYQKARDTMRAEVRLSEPRDGDLSLDEARRLVLALSTKPAEEPKPYAPPDPDPYSPEVG